jgi:hypothetical protein
MASAEAVYHLNGSFDAMQAIGGRIMASERAVGRMATLEHTFCKESTNHVQGNADLRARRAAAFH